MTAPLESLLSGVTPPGLFEWRGAVDRDIAGPARGSGWQVRELNSCRSSDAASFYDDLASQWALPPWFGRNLDALWDVLGDLATAPLLVIWRGLGDFAETDPQMAHTVLELLRDASTQATAFAVIVMDSPAAGVMKEGGALSGLDGLS